MARRIGGGWRVNRLALGVWVFGALVLLGGLFLAFQFVGPPPPRQIVLATGAEGGAYQAYGVRIAEYLEGQGVAVELRETAGAVENLALLKSESGVDAAFVQSGLAEDYGTDGVVALGSMYLEPIWVFARNEINIELLADLRGKRLAVGAEGSGTRVVIRRMLAANDISEGNATMLDVAAEDLVSAFSSGDIDAAFLIAGAESELVTSLTAQAGIKLLGLHRADAYARRASYLRKVVLPEGVLSLQKNRPDKDTPTVAVTAMLVVQEDIHPAISDLLMMATDTVFSGHTILADAGEFPSPLNTDIPLSKEAQRFHDRGTPFLMRYLPFWAATLIDRLWVLAFPVIGLLIPLFKLLPPLYHWRIRRKLLQRYTELREIDPQHSAVVSLDDRRERLERIRELDNETVDVVVPKDYSADIYKLRRDIDLVRRKLEDVVIG